jgi:hypothetical protein
VIHLIAGRRDDLGRVRPSRLAGHGAGVDPRHLEDVLKQPVETFHFGLDQLALVEAVGVAQRSGLQIGRRHADRRERRAQVVAQRRQQRRLQLLAPASQLTGFAFLQELRALDGNGHDAGEGVERACLHWPARRRQQSDGSGAHPERHQSHRSTVDLHRLVAGVGARVGVELERGLRRRERRGELPGVQGDGRGSGIEHVPLAESWQRDGHVLEVEPPRHRPRERRQGFTAVGGAEHVATEVEEPGHLVAPAERLRAAASRRRRQVARHQAHGEERDQRDPVLRFGDGEGAERRQKEEVEGEHGHDRGDDSDPQRRGRRDDQDHHQERRRDGGGVRDLQPGHQAIGDRSDRAEPSRQASDVGQTARHRARS